jgi:6-phosphogluconate dehydrogenase
VGDRRSAASGNGLATQGLHTRSGNGDGARGGQYTDHSTAEIWRYGSVVRSWLLESTSAALDKNPTMDGIAPWVDDSGEGRWMVAEAIDLDIPAPVITLSLLARLRSRDPDSFSDKLLSAMRNQFGGHPIKKD